MTQDASQSSNDYSFNLPDATPNSVAEALAEPFPPMEAFLNNSTTEIAKPSPINEAFQKDQIKFEEEEKSIEESTNDV